MNNVDRLRLLKSYAHRGFRLVLLKPRSKIPLVKWKDYQLSNEDFLCFLSQGANWAIRCDETFHVLDFDDAETYERFVQGEGSVLKDAPTVRTGRGYHVWFKPKNLVNSFSIEGIEVKGLGSLVVVPPSIHSTGVEYDFERPLDGKLPEIKIEELFGLDSLNQANQKQASSEKTLWCWLGRVAALPSIIAQGLWCAL